ncbi:hypothetical protein DC347_10745 [Pseudarthrobacter sp. AG30]|nr:hypothetical protein DC347_10745 [Pseudarthrobacter sp. AG30]
MSIMHILEAATLINARTSTVWEILTDAGNYTVWESGITDIDGEVRNGSTIRVRTTSSGERRYRLRVEQIPGEVMTWTGGLPLGLYKNVRTFTLSTEAAMTHLRVTEEHTGPLAGLLAKPVPNAQQSFTKYVQAVKARAELFG